MNADTLVVVLAYDGDKHQVEMLMPHYAAHGCSVVVMSPTDAPITESAQTGVIFRQGGLRGWIGRDTALARYRAHMRMALEYPFGHYVFFDADSVCLSPKLPRYLYETPDVFWSNEVLDTNPGPSYLPKLALQPPYVTSRKVLEKLVDAPEATSYYGDFGPLPEQKLPVPTECPDHWLLQICHGAGVEHRNFFDGCSFETASEHGLATMANLVQSHNRIFLHSVKTKDRLDRLAASRLHSSYKP